MTFSDAGTILRVRPKFNPLQLELGGGEALQSRSGKPLVPSVKMLAPHFPVFATAVGAIQAAEFPDSSRCPAIAEVDLVAQQQIALLTRSSATTSRP